MNNTTPKNSSHIQSVDKAIQLIELLARENREMSLTEIAKKMGWAKSTVHGLLSTLRSHHYIDQSPITGHYHLGVRLFELGKLVERNWNIRSIALPAMQKLNNTLGEMVQLATEDKGEVLYLEKFDSTQMMRIVSEVGARLPMHCSALGKVLLAYKPKSEVKWILLKHGMQAMTARTISNQQSLFKELEKIREQGFAVDDREIMDNLRCIAVPIWDENNEVKYALSVSGFANRLQGEHIERARELLLAAAKDISFSMGYRERSSIQRSQT